MVHGFATSSADSWARFGWIAAFEERGQRVVAPDLPGHGGAEKYTVPEEYGVIEDVVLGYARQLTPVSGVGFSMGARLILSVEIDQPGTFERLVIGGVGANIFSFRSPEHLAGAIESRDHSKAPDNSMAEAFVRGAYKSENSAAALAAFLRRPLRRRILAEGLASVKCPVLVVVGDDDEMVQPVSALTEHLTHAEVVRVPRADHLATMRSREFLDASLDFLAPT